MNAMLAASGDAWGLKDKFDLFGPAHLGVFLAMAIVVGGMAWIARNPHKAGLTTKLELSLAMLLLWSFPAKILTRYLGDVPIDAPLPMQFCDWAAIAGFLALVMRSERMIEVTYFWGMAGTLQGLVTPNIEVGYPHPAWFAFFQLHAGVVAAALYFVLGKGWRPRKGAVLRVFVLANLYLVAAAIVDLMSVENNYGFLRKKPENGSLMDALGPWPIYIVAIQGLALVIFILFDMPFWRGRKRRAVSS